MAYAQQLRMVDIQNIPAVAEAQAEHLAYGVDSSDEHNDCRKKAAICWSNGGGTRMERADISADYAKQAFLPSVAARKTKDFFAGEQGLNVDLFGICNEGSGLQKTMISSERAFQDSNTVVSQLLHYLTHVDQRVGRCEELYVHRASCTGQSKTIILLGYYGFRVHLGYHDKVFLKLMTVGHTKFGPDRVFGNIRVQMKAGEALSIPEFISNIVNESAQCPSGLLFDHYTGVRDYKSETNRLFKKVPGFRANFYYSMTISKSEARNSGIQVTTSIRPLHASCMRETYHTS